jgi:hypothetical protein
MIKGSRRTQDVWLYYKFYSSIFRGKFLLVAVKKSLRAFVLTCYITDEIKKGELVWQKK